MEPMEPSARKKAQDRELEKARQHQEEVQKNSAKQAWIADGGEEADFEKAWPEMRRQIRAERTKEASEAARRQNAERARRMF